MSEKGIAKPHISDQIRKKEMELEIFQKRLTIQQVFVVIMVLAFIGLFALTMENEAAGMFGVTILLLIQIIGLFFMNSNNNSLKETEEALTNLHNVNAEMEKDKNIEKWREQEILEAQKLVDSGELSNMKMALTRIINLGYNVDSIKEKIAIKKEELLDYDGAIILFEELGLHSNAKRVRRKILDEKKVDQTVVHGDYVDDRDTIVKDSVINRSNVGAGSSKMQELEKLAEMKDKGIIDDDDYEKMKREIIG
jgi:hypothetical protein